MAAKKFAISVPEEVMDEVDRAAAALGMTRSGYVTYLLQKVARARKDAEITRRVNALFADPEIAQEQVETARAYARRVPSGEGTEW